jgi:hypothetical protein
MRMRRGVWPVAGPTLAGGVLFFVYSGLTWFLAAGFVDNSLTATSYYLAPAAIGAAGVQGSAVVRARAGWQTETAARGPLAVATLELAPVVLWPLCLAASLTALLCLPTALGSRSYLSPAELLDGTPVQLLLPPCILTVVCCAAHVVGRLLPHRVTGPLTAAAWAYLLFATANFYDLAAVVHVAGQGISPDFGGSPLFPQPPSPLCRLSLAPPLLATATCVLLTARQWRRAVLLLAATALSSWALSKAFV